MKKPVTGGSYRRDPATGKLERIEHTAPAPGRGDPRVKPGDKAAAKEPDMKTKGRK